MEKRLIIIVAIGAIVVAGASFWGGVTFAKSSTPQRGTLAGAGGQFAGRTGGGFRASANGGAFGTIVSKDSNSITVQLGGPNASSTPAGQAKVNRNVNMGIRLFPGQLH